MKKYEMAWLAAFGFELGNRIRFASDQREHSVIAAYEFADNVSRIVREREEAPPEKLKKMRSTPYENDSETQDVEQLNPVSQRVKKSAIKKDRKITNDTNNKDERRER